MIPIFATAFAVSTPATSNEFVPVSHFNSVELRGGGKVTIAPGSSQRVSIVEGSGQVTSIHVERDNRLVIETCNGECPSAYRLRVEIQSPLVPDLAVNGGGQISTINGFAPQRQLSAAVNGGGSIDARSVEVSNVSAAVNGGGELFVHAGAMLTGAVNGGGHVRYWGNPRVTSALHGGGSVAPGH